MLILPLALAAVFSSSPAADVQRLELEGVDIKVSYVWPESIYGGYFPIHFEFQNTNDAQVDIEVMTRSMWNRGFSRKELRLEPGEHYSFDLLTVGLAERVDQQMIGLTVEGREKWLRNNVGPSDSDNGHREVVLLATPESTPPGTRARWEDALGEKDFHVGEVRLAELPTRFEAYTSIDAVVLDVSEGLPDEARLEALLRWLRLGGTLVLFGQERLSGRAASQVARANEQLGRWIEARFSMSEAGVQPEIYTYSHGRLILLDDSDPLKLRDRRDLLEEGVLRGRLGLGDANTGWVPREVGTRARRNGPQRPPMSPLPLKTLAAMLVIFALLIGPVNFIVVKRMGRPVLLLITVPVLAFIASAGLLGYGVFHQGLDVKAVTRSFTLLDQRTHRSSTIELHNLFAGSSPGRGLLPGAGTVCLINDSELDFETELRIDQTDGTLLAADFLPVRAEVRHVLLTDVPDRARLQVTREGGRPTVTNGLGARLETLVLCTQEGELYRLAEPLADGGGAQLIRLEDGEEVELRGWSSVMMSRVLGEARAAMPAATYVARLDASPFLDSCGLDVIELEPEHVLIGVLDIDGEEWR